MNRERLRRLAEAGDEAAQAEVERDEERQRHVFENDDDARTFAELSKHAHPDELVTPRALLALGKGSFALFELQWQMGARHARIDRQQRREAVRRERQRRLAQAAEQAAAGEDVTAFSRDE